ncbi:MAG TPA: aryl-sulfate sulfotransferase [Solirubrobacterales bacterium]|nr:aryl-sulfate sulfotransferase [Solirubrobacterales bacterium]
MKKQSRDAGSSYGGRAGGWMLAVVALALLTSVAVATARTVGRGDADPARAQTCLGQAATVAATPGEGELVGGPGPDVIVGSPGADRIDGRGGGDLICAGAGNDVVLGSGGDDRLVGGGGKDLLRGGLGNDQVWGQRGSDRLFGGAGDDRLAGGGDSDRCDEGAGSNKLTGCEQVPHENPETQRVNRVLLARDVSGSTDEDSATSIDAAAVGSDADGDALAFTSLDTSASTGAAMIVDGGARIRFDPSGRFDGLAAGKTAQDAFRYAIDDGYGGTASAKVTMTVTGVDDPPKAVDDEATVQEGDETTAIPVRGNDTDPDGGPSSIESVTQPAHGTVAIANGGLDLTYQPNPGYCNDGEAADNFPYTVNGGSEATVRVTVNCVTEVSISQGLSPKFDPSVTDYTVRCDGSPLDVSGRTAKGAEIAVDGQQAQAGTFRTTVSLEANQAFSFEVTDGGTPSTYYVRCLPANFGAWEYEGLLAPSHAFYVVTPTLGAGAGPYAVIFDNHGVPIWWDTESPAAPSDAKVLPDGTIAWWSNTAPHGDDYEIHNFDGTLVSNLFAASGRTDSHDLQLEPNGNYFLLSYQPREHVDLTAFGGGLDDTVTDAVIEELKPNNESVWSWSTQGHIGLEETGRWWPTALASSAADIVHMNAVEPAGEDAILISLRHTDAVYKIKKSTGEVIWKLGGTWTPKSLTVKGDPEGAYPLGGQHDVRLQPDGTITIHDNNTDLPDPPRAVRYRIDEAAKTATLVEEVTDPRAPSSFCCGSARRSADGSWLLSWGGRSLVTEFNSAGQRTFALGFGGTVFSYRAAPADGVPSTNTLRAGMDAMHPRP